jgi:hypothetical protein
LMRKVPLHPFPAAGLLDDAREHFPDFAFLPRRGDPHRSRHRFRNGILDGERLSAMGPTQRSSPLSAASDSSSELAADWSDLALRHFGEMAHTSRRGFASFFRGSP